MTFNKIILIANSLEGTDDVQIEQVKQILNHVYKYVRIYL